MENQHVSEIDQPDSFDDMKIEQVDMEPVFSTASGIRIDVKAESIEKSKQLFQKDPAVTNKKFMSPVVKSHATAFISPFRSTGQSESLKRPADEEKVATPIKRGKPSTSSQEIFGKIVRIENIEEDNERRFVVLEKSTKRKILVRENLHNNSSLKLFNSVKIETYQKLEEENEIKADQLFLRPAENLQVEEHSFASFPYTRKPCFIHELRPNEKNIQVAVLKVNIVDFGPKFYQGCSKCQYRFNGKYESNRRLPTNCPKCGEKAENEKCIYSIMRIVDFSGQLEIHVPHETMQNFLRMLGYTDVKEMDKFSNLQEQMNYVFKPIMVRIRRRNQEEWIAEEFANVDWQSYSRVLEQKFAKECISAQSVSSISKTID